VGTAPTTSTGTNHGTWAPSTSTWTAGTATGSTPASVSTATVHQPITMPVPASVTGGTASGLAVIAQ